MDTAMAEFQYGMEGDEDLEKRELSFSRAWKLRGINCFPLLAKYLQPLVIDVPTYTGKYDREKMATGIREQV